MKSPKYLLVSALFALCIAFASCAGASAATPPRTDAWPLHHAATFKLDSRGPRVATLQFLIRKPRPKANRFTAVAGTLKPRTFTRGIFDKPTFRAVVEYRWKIGYPGRGQCLKEGGKARVALFKTNQVGPYFFALLLGQKNRPACWVALATKRRQVVALGVTPTAQRLVSFEKSQLGISEPYAYVKYNGYFRLPVEAWCAIFQNYSLVHIGLAKIGADNPWYVPSIIEYGRRHGYLTGVAKVGEWALYYGDTSHIGLVVAVHKDGSYETIDGNWSNRVAGPNYRGASYPLHYFYADPRLVRR